MEQGRFFAEEGGKAAALEECSFARHGQDLFYISLPGPLQAALHQHLRYAQSGEFGINGQASELGQSPGIDLQGTASDDLIPGDRDDK